MKIRIQGNSLRLRLSKSEVEVLKDKKLVMDSISFGDSKLTYSLSANAVESVRATYDHGNVMVSVPLEEARDWATTSRVGISTSQSLNDDGVLSILIEKDFKCLSARDENEEDLFANPKATD